MTYANVRAAARLRNVPGLRVCLLSSVCIVYDRYYSEWLARGRLRPVKFATRYVIIWRVVFTCARDVLYCVQVLDHIILSPGATTRWREMIPSTSRRTADLSTRIEYDHVLLLQLVFWNSQFMGLRGIVIFPTDLCKPIRMALAPWKNITCPRQVIGVYWGEFGFIRVS